VKRYEFSFGPSAGPSRAAVGGFPYPGRTVEELDIQIEDRWENCLLSERGRGKMNWGGW